MCPSVTPGREGRPQRVHARTHTHTYALARAWGRDGLGRLRQARAMVRQSGRRGREAREGCTDGRGDGGGKGREGEGEREGGEGQGRSGQGWTEGAGMDGGD